MPKSFTRRVVAPPHYLRNTRTAWKEGDEAHLRRLIARNTPTRVIGLHLGRSEGAVRNKAARLGLSLLPINRSPYGRHS